MTSACVASSGRWMCGDVQPSSWARVIFMPDVAHARRLVADEDRAEPDLVAHCGERVDCAA